MAVDILTNELVGMTEEQIMQVIAFARFIKFEAQNYEQSAAPSSHSHKRTPGGMPGKLWMADDFDATPDCFAEYM